MHLENPRTTQPPIHVRVLRFLARREVRFLAVGGANTVIGVALFQMFHLLLGPRIGYVLVLLPTYAVGTLIAFTSQRLLVFGVEGHLGGDLARFTLVQATALALNAVFLPALVEGLGIPVLIGQIGSLVLVAVATYFAHLLFSFGPRTDRA